jgi:hypothetical protein
MTRTTRGFLLCALLALSACGDDDGTGPNNNAGTVNATVGGVAFSGTLAQAATYSNGVLAIAATQSTGGSNVNQINITMNGVNGTGTFPLGGSSVNQGIYTEVANFQAKIWTASLPGGTGSVQLTTLTPTRAAGTFTATLQPTTNTGATGTKSVTSGTFDVTIGE